MWEVKYPFHMIQQLQHWVHTLKKLNPTVMNASTLQVYYSAIHSAHKNRNMSDIYPMKSRKMPTYNEGLSHNNGEIQCLFVSLLSFETGPRSETLDGL